MSHYHHLSTKEREGRLLANRGREEVSEAEKEMLPQKNSRRSGDQGICAAEDTGRAMVA